MKKTGIFYGSATGTTADVAQRIAARLGIADADIHDVAGTAPDTLGAYENLILGSSTWGSGELEDDWYDFADGASSLDLSGKKIALFGCGDETMSDTFCDAVGELFARFKKSGAVFIGEFPADAYTFTESKATDGNTMRGLLIDEVNHPEMTDDRILKWTEHLKKEM